jgi:hypothetical protein
MNGVVEASNKNVKKMIVTYKVYHEILLFALHQYRTTVKTLIGATPFSLVYRIEAVMPLEVEVPSFEGIDRF